MELSLIGARVPQIRPHRGVEADVLTNRATQQIGNADNQLVELQDLRDKMATARECQQLISQAGTKRRGAPSLNI
ncbi:MAG: hypothetical protein EHM67_05225, partial [Hyphomicrobiaceae bacterium]